MKAERSCEICHKPLVSTGFIRHVITGSCLCDRCVKSLDMPLHSPHEFERNGKRLEKPKDKVLA
jgi:hypothetical protein